MDKSKIDRAKANFGIIGESMLLNRAIEVALLVAPTDLSVLITGENGTGKESFSKIIHHFSARKHCKFISVNCGAIPEGTIDSELFGHIKGAFTGAEGNRKGYFEEVNNGTIFLDEIGEMPLETQVKLLRVLENGEIIPVGSSKVQKVDVRVIAATNVNMIKKVQEGKFREDLYYRLNTVPINIPPLRNRNDDIILLFNKFAGDFADKYSTSQVILTNESKDLLLKYQFPGNIRQLKNIVEQMSILESKKIIEVDVLEKYLPENEKMFLSTNINNENKYFNNIDELKLLYNMILELKKENNEIKKVLLDIIEKNKFDSVIFEDNKGVNVKNNVKNIDKLMVDSKKI